MTSSKMIGKHYEVDGTCLTIFGIKGFPHGNNWAIEVWFSEEAKIPVEVSPDPVSPKIEEVIEQDRAEGKEEKIDHVLLSSRYALTLWLEGKLTQQHFRDAREDDETIILSMEIGGRERTIKVRDED